MAISPISPGAMWRPSSSMIAMSVDGTGRPMVPVNSVLSARLQVATGEVSDKP